MAISQCFDDSRPQTNSTGASTTQPNTNSNRNTPVTNSGMSTPTHVHNSNITHLDYDSQTKVLVTADHFGTVCMWKYVSYASILLHRTIDGNMSNQDLDSSPICGLLLPLALPLSLYQRVTRIKLSPSSQQVAISMTDKLILVAIGTGIMNSTSVSDVKYKVYKHPSVNRYYSLPQRPLYIRATLDTLPKPKYIKSICAQYVVQFTCEDIKIWRFMNCNSPAHELPVSTSKRTGSNVGSNAGSDVNDPTVSDGIAITYWSHANLDYPVFVTSPLVCSTPDTTNASATTSVSHPRGPNLVYSRHVNRINYSHPSNNSNNSYATGESATSPVPVPATCRPTQGSNYIRLLMKAFTSEHDPAYLKRTDPSRDPITTESNSIVQSILEVCCAMNMKVHTHRPTISLVAAALELPYSTVHEVISTTLSSILSILPSSGNASNVGTSGIICARSDNMFKWLCSREDVTRIGNYYWIDAMNGHNAITALYLHYCANKSIAIEHSWQEYLKTYGPAHLRKCSRGLRLFTRDIRKIDETANIRGVLPLQLGYVSGLQELYARRVGLTGNLPWELGELSELRVLSMGNNKICGKCVRCGIY